MLIRVHPSDCATPGPATTRPSSRTGVASARQRIGRVVTVGAHLDAAGAEGRAEPFETVAGRFHAEHCTFGRVADVIGVDGSVDGGVVVSLPDGGGVVVPPLLAFPSGEELELEQPLRVGRRLRPH